jgi:arylsulfatase A-like enzyme/tetratricopeptide (TPR) repeat protein
MKMKKRRDPRAIVIVLAAAAALCMLFWFVLRPGKAPSQKVLGMWKDLGVEKPNIILITLDTTRADHLACYGYSDVRTPTLDALAGRGVLFEQCASSSPLTLPSHSTIMTGMYPTYHGVRVNGNTALSDEQTTIAEVLAAKGYSCGAFIGGFVLDGRWGLKQGFQHYDDQFDLKKYKTLDLGGVQRPGNEVVDATLAWLGGQKDKTFFAWVHLYDPHAPYEPPEPYLSEYRQKGKGLVSLYDGEIAFMDSQIGRLLEWLGKSGLDSNTLVVLIGDHGEGLQSHGEGAHGYFIYDSVAHVPFLVVAPFNALQGVRVRSQVRTVDLFPTVLEFAGIEPPVKVHGRSLLPRMFDPKTDDQSFAYGESMTPSIQFGWSPLYFLRTTRFKFIAAPRPEFYDLAQDPGEERDVQDRYPDRALTMKKALDRLITETSAGAPKLQAANLDKETMERLSALGYIGAPVPSTKSSSKVGRPLADPKDKLPIFNAVQRGGELVSTDKFSEAAEFLESALKEDPTIPQALLMLATCYSNLGRTEEAKANLDLVLKDDPESVQALISLANILLAERKNEDVIAVCRRAISLDDRNNQAHTLIGEVYMGEEKYSAALPYLEKAVEIQPKLSRSRLTLAACLVGVKQYDRAETALKEVVREAPKFPLAHYNLGLLYEEQGRLEEARAAYTEEVANFPKEFKARFNLGKLLFKLGDRAGSLEQMREVVKITPNLAEGHLLLARGLLYETVPLDEIQVTVEKGLSLAQTADLKALGYFLLADIYNRKNQPDMMRDALQKANSYKSAKK